jgi:hypothetical protein
VYTTGLVKLVVVLETGEMLAPVEREMIGVRLVTSVPEGTIREIVLFVLLTIPVTAGVARLKDDIAVVELGRVIAIFGSPTNISFQFML